MVKNEGPFRALPLSQVPHVDSRDNRVKPEGDFKTQDQHAFPPVQSRTPQPLEHRIKPEAPIKRENHARQDGDVFCPYCRQDIADWEHHRTTYHPHANPDPTETNADEHDSAAESDPDYDPAEPYHPGDAVGYHPGYPNAYPGYPPMYGDLPMPRGLENDPEALRRLFEIPDVDIPAEDRLSGPRGLKATLKEHQKIGLTWLINREQGDEKGSILADDMGLGKTIQAIALILSCPPNDRTRKTTLIVMPTALLRQWEREIEDKVSRRLGLKTFIYHGQKKRNMTVAKLLSHDVVLTTYGTIGHEYAMVFDKRRTGAAVLLASHCIFHRVILDEAHNIKNRASRMSKATLCLRANYRVCMTGTPLQNRLEELWPLLAFLQIKPWGEWEFFRRMKKGEGEDLHKIHFVLSKIMLRRTAKTIVDGHQVLTLPEVIIHTEEATFDEDQRSLYVALETKTNIEVNRFIKAGTVLKHYFYILVLLLRLRQCCCHPHLLKDQDIPEGIQMTADEMIRLAKKLPLRIVNRIESMSPFKCPSCDQETQAPVIISPCGHIICGPCVSVMVGLQDPTRPVEEEEEQQVEDTYIGDCPTCKDPIDPKAIVCYKFFAEVHLGQEEDADSSAKEAEVEDDDEGSLKDFIVSDDHQSDDEDVKRKKSPPRLLAKDEEELGNEGKLDTLECTSKVDSPDVKTEKNDDFDAGTVADPRLGIDGADPKVEGDDYDSDDSFPDIEVILARPRKQKLEDNKPKIKREATPLDLSDDEDAYVGQKRKRGSDKSAIKSEKKVKQETKRETKRGGTREVKQEIRGETKKGAAREAKHLNGKRQPAARTKGAVRSSVVAGVGSKTRYFNNLRKEYTPSSKIDKLLDLLEMIRTEHPDEKTLVFSQFTAFLDLIEIAVTDAGHNYRRYDGSMSTSERETAIDDFRLPDVKVLLISLKAGNAGLNLQSASRIIILDPFWNPSIEQQAIGRAHRIGQEREVNVYRILVSSTVEDQIIALQEKKKTLVESVLDPNARRGISRLSPRELAGLFGLVWRQVQR